MVENHTNTYGNHGKKQQIGLIFVFDEKKTLAWPEGIFVESDSHAYAHESIISFSNLAFFISFNIILNETWITK